MRVGPKEQLRQSLETVRVKVNTLVPPNFVFNQVYSNAKILFQSFFMLITVQFLAFASSSEAG